MRKTISALKARQNLGQIMNEVALKEDDYIIERAGKPLVAVISMGKYQYLQESQAKAFSALDEIWEKMKDQDSVVVKKAIDEAVKSVRET